MDVEYVAAAESHPLAVSAAASGKAGSGASDRTGCAAGSAEEASAGREDQVPGCVSAVCRLCFRPKDIPQAPRNSKPPCRLHHLHRRLTLVRTSHIQMDRPARRLMERPNCHRPRALHLRRLGPRHRKQHLVRPQPIDPSPVVEGNGLAGRPSGWGYPAK